MAESMSLPVPDAEVDPLRALFDRARSGDGAALDRLCAAMRPRLYRTAWAILQDPDDADDVAQEALVRAVTRRFLFLGRGSVSGWMVRIAMNLARNRMRDTRRRREILEHAQPHERSARGAEPSAPSAPDVVAEEHQARTRLHAALAGLPERQREVVQLHAVAGLSFAEVAAALKITEANARVTYSQARRKLLDMLQVAADGGSP